MPISKLKLTSTTTRYKAERKPRQETVEYGEIDEAEFTTYIKPTSQGYTQLLRLTFYGYEDVEIGIKRGKVEIGKGKGVLRKISARRREGLLRQLSVSARNLLDKAFKEID